MLNATNPAVDWKTSCLLAMADDARSVGWSRPVLGSVRAGEGLGGWVGFGQGGSTDAIRSLLEGGADRGLPLAWCGSVYGTFRS